MLDLIAFREFREGLALLRDGDAGAALGFLRHAAERDWEDPYYLSYYGLSLGLAEGKWADAERLCHSALCRGRRQVQLYLNLADLYQAGGKPQAAADTLAQGLHQVPNDPRLRMQLGRLVMRRPAVLHFLPRTHSLNQRLGRWRHLLLQRLPRRKWLAVGTAQPQARQVIQ